MTELTPPEGLLEKGLEAWARIHETAPWIDPQVDRTAVELLCKHLDEREALKAALDKNPGDWRGRNALRDLDRLITAELSSLGLTPSDRTRQGIKEKELPEPIPDYLKPDLERLGITDMNDPRVLTVKRRAMRRFEEEMFYNDMNDPH